MAISPTVSSPSLATRAQFERLKNETLALLAKEGVSATADVRSNKAVINLATGGKEVTVEIVNEETRTPDARTPNAPSSPFDAIKAQLTLRNVATSATMKVVKLSLRSYAPPLATASFAISLGWSVLGLLISIAGLITKDSKVVNRGYKMATDDDPLNAVFRSAVSQVFSFLLPN